MGDRERKKGKQKMPYYGDFVDSSASASRRTRARMTMSLGLGGEGGAGGNPSPSLLHPQDRGSRTSSPVAGGGGEESERGGQLQAPPPATDGQQGAAMGASGSGEPQPRANADVVVVCRYCHSNPHGDQCLLHGMDPADIALDQQLRPQNWTTVPACHNNPHTRDSSVRNPVTLMPAPPAETPSSSSQMNFAWDSTQQRPYVTEAQLAATMEQLPRPQAPSSSQAQRSRRQQPGIGPISFPPTHTSGSLPQGRSMRVPSSGAQRGGTSGDGDSARGRGLQMQAPAPVTHGQPGAATGASGSGQLQLWSNCLACYSMPQGYQCLVCGRGVYPGIYHLQRQASPPPQQGQTHLPAAPTNHGFLVGEQLSASFGTWKPHAFGLEGQAQTSANAGQPETAAGTLGSGQLLSWANANAVVQCQACHNDPQGYRCPFCGRAPVNPAIHPLQRQHPPPAQHGHTRLPAAPANHGFLSGLHSGIIIGQQPSRHALGHWKPPGLGGLAQPSADAGQHHFLQVREDRLCPVCLERPMSFAVDPQPHDCLCPICYRSYPFLCRICSSEQGNA